MKNILFDLYGTLVDIHTDEECDLFWINLAKRTKNYKDYDAIELRNQYLKICDELSKEKEEIEILDVFERLFETNKEESQNIATTFRKLSTEYIKLYPRVKLLLKKLKENGHRIFILSNAQSAFTIQELQKLGLINYFDGIAISSEYGLKKPNPNFYKKAIKKFGIKEDIWMIGNDFECDINPAKKLGLKTIFIESNLTPPCKHDANVKGFDYKKILELLNN